MKIKKIFLITFIILSILIVKSEACYTYEKEINIFSLSRNLTKPTYIKTYQKDTWTNQDVIVNINADKVIKNLNGDFIVSQDGKSLTKILSQNETGKVKIIDEDYNIDEIEYEVNWIDKEAPQIIGVEDGNTYNKNLQLEYTDNGEIEEIFVSKYNDSFYANIGDVFIDKGDLRFIPVTSHSITALVRKHTKQIEKYSYYLDNVLYATTDSMKYTFKNLSPCTYNIPIKIEGLDRNNQVVDTIEYTIKTGVFEDIELVKTDTVETIKLVGIEEIITRLEAYVWIQGDYDETITCKEVNIENQTASYNINIEDFDNRKENYIIHFYFYYNEDNVEKILEVFGGEVDMSQPYVEESINSSINEISVSGNYYIRVQDKAGNETEVDFVLQK